MNILLAVLFGIFAAIGWGVAPIYSKRAYSNGGSPITAGLVLSTVGSLFLFIILIVIYSPEIFFKYELNQVYPFIISGITATGIGRVMSYYGVDLVGASVNSSFVGSYSIPAIIFAYLLLGENLTYTELIGVLIVVTGLVTVTLSDSGNKKEDWSKFYILVPLLASFMWGFGSVIRRFGMNTVSNVPIIYATFINEIVALTVISIYVFFIKRDILDDFNIKNYKKFTLSGMFNIVGTTSSFAALNFGPVYIGSTLGSTATIVTVVLTWIFLNDLEDVTKKLYLGTILVVIGVIIVVL